MRLFCQKLVALMMGASLFTSPTTATHFDDEDSIHFQAPIRGTRESQDWLYHPHSGKFVSPKGQVIEPWNQPKEIRDLRQQGYGLDTLQSLLVSSVLRVNPTSNGELTLYLSGRLRGGMKRTGRRLPDEGYTPNFVPDIVITPAPRRPVNKSQSFKYGLDDSSDDDWIDDDGYESETQEEKDAHNDRILTNEVSKKVKQNPNTLIVFKEKKRSVRKEQLKKLNIAWDKKLGQKVKGASHYTYSRNAQGNTALKDSRKGIVYPAFLEDRARTDSFLPQKYPTPYPAQDVHLGGWLINRYTQYKLKLNKVLIGGVGKSFKGPIHRVLSEKQHRTTGAILATFGIVTNKMGPGGLRKLSVELETSDRDLSRLLFEAHQWLGLFNNPNKYFVVNMEHPIAQFKGTTVVRSHIPKTIRYEMWPKTMQNFKKSLVGTSSLQDPRNGLCYPLYSVNYSNPQAMLPKGYEITDEHVNVGYEFLENLGDCGIQILEELIGIPKQAHANPGVRVIMERGCQALAATTGLALDTMLNNGELAKSVERAIKKKVRGVYTHIKLINEIVQELVRNGIGKKSEAKKLDKLVSTTVNANPQDFEPDSDDEKEKEENKPEERKENPAKAESKVWKELKNFKKDVKTNGKNGKSRRYYQWDHLHNEIEMYDSQKRPIDAIDPQTGARLNKDVSNHKPLNI